ncbi:GGDEF domain-containing phosphodiesterase [Stakelama tenebrarum]|uniref:EAL domain-containing protein n=1 Tax=Stakelama tenebrarum TaxID=2711215 RepID=A0A6G6Y5E1_9SPHN|nr:GGDEF domain-containing phosphodiesterase [Sphingosinithalassobacter tenebrarum]QIG80135.1 EAL domain-containing protein [Sphingosinithalassobacter tenebrarum]
MNDRDPAAPVGAPLFLLSFRQRDELGAVAANAGWRVVGARRAEGAARRFLASGAAVALVDARGALEEGLAAVGELGGVVSANGAALLVLVSRGDSARLGEFLDAGATHFLASPMREGELVQALRYAERFVARVGGWEKRETRIAEPLGWRWDPALRSLQLTPALAKLLGMPVSASPRACLERLDAEDRVLARAAFRRLSDAMPSTAFAHDLAGVGRVVEHLQYDPQTRRLHALVEPLGAAPDAGAAVREALHDARDAAGARRWIERRLGEGRRVSAMLVALDRFETINEAHGRATGDALLGSAGRRVSDAAREVLGRHAIVARMGGPEFLVAAVDAGDMAMATLRTLLDEALTRPFVTGNGVISLAVRIAMVESNPGEPAPAMLRRLSERLIDGGEARVEPLDQLAGDVQGAIDRGEIATLFQPQVAVSTGKLSGTEALARWNHPQRGEIGAETLFAAAARADMTATLSEHVQARALAAAAAWPAVLKPLRLSINVTAEDVARPGFADRLLGRIDASGFPRSRLTIEITESSIMEELGEAARLLAELRTAGCRVAIDDFGTGYSSLAYLKALPLDYLKIDKKLSQDITGSARDRIVVRGVIDMARSLGLTVIAEGVETREQLELLAKDGCQYVQGFLFAEPLDVAALTAMMEAET